MRVQPRDCLNLPDDVGDLRHAMAFFRDCSNVISATRARGKVHNQSLSSMARTELIGEVQRQERTFDLGIKRAILRSHGQNPAYGIEVPPLAPHRMPPVRPIEITRDMSGRQGGPKPYRKPRGARR